MLCMGLFHWLFWPLEQSLKGLLELRWLPWVALGLLMWTLSEDDRGNH